MIVGVLGAGQLGRMLAMAGHRLGIETRFLDPAREAPAAQVAATIQGPLHDRRLLELLAEGAAAVTYELEQAPLGAARWLAGRVPVRPGPQALAACQDRLPEKRLLRSLGIETPAFAPVGSDEELGEAASSLRFPVILKTRCGGYDGRGQRRVPRPEDLPAAWAKLGRAPSIAEELVHFDRELSIVAARGLDGALTAYPLVENVHRDGILHVTLAPAPGAGPDLQAAAERLAGAILESLEYVGVAAVELFEVGGRLLANEIAPRVHNSGHWTIEGAETSQFENHLRAVCELPLGPAGLVRPSAMVNLIGTIPPLESLLAGALPASVHLYGKSPAPDRKLGHVTLGAGDEAQRDELLGSLLARLDSLGGSARVAELGAGSSPQKSKSSPRSDPRLRRPRSPYSSSR